MQLKKIKRAEKKGSESVVDEKFSLFFNSKFFVGGEIECQVRLDKNDALFFTINGNVLPLFTSVVEF